MIEDRAMGVLSRLLGIGDGRWPRPADTFTVLGGGWALEVVGESFDGRQDFLARLVGGRERPVRHPVTAVLVPEPDNPVSAWAIAVHVKGVKVGYLSEVDAGQLHAGCLALESRLGTRAALGGVVVGGAGRSMGVFLDFDPLDFGADRSRYPEAPNASGWSASAATPVPVNVAGRMRTGRTEAILSDAADDSYDLSWLAGLPGSDARAISYLRRLLEHDPDPIDRHFQYCELEERLYRCRDAFASALDDFDAACLAHDAEMDRIGPALVGKFGGMPHLPTYRQSVIRLQKAARWQEALTWADRGISLYGTSPIRPEDVEDLRKRAQRCRDRLSAPARVERLQKQPVAEPVLEVLVCTAGCGRSFERMATRGRKPTRCPSCRAS